VIVDAPAVWTNVAVRLAPETDAVIVTWPGDEPSVTWAFAWPAASVATLVGVTVALPAVTAKATVAPLTAVPLAVTRTTRGEVNGVPTS